MRQKIMFVVAVLVMVLSSTGLAPVPAKAAPEPPNHHKGLVCNRSDRYIYVLGNYKSTNWEWTLRGMSPGSCTARQDADIDAVYYKTCMTVNNQTTCTLKAKKVGYGDVTVRNGGAINVVPWYYLRAECAWFSVECGGDYPLSNVPGSVRPQTSWINYTIR